MSWRFVADILSSPQFLSNLWSPSCSCTSTLLYGLVIGVLVGLLIPLVCSKGFVVSVLKVWLAQQPATLASDAQQSELTLSEPRRKQLGGKPVRLEVGAQNGVASSLDERTLKRIQALRYVVPHQDH